MLSFHIAKAWLSEFRSYSLFYRSLIVYIDVSFRTWIWTLFLCQLSQELWMLEQYLLFFLIKAFFPFILRIHIMMWSSRWKFAKFMYYRSFFFSSLFPLRLLIIIYGNKTHKVVEMQLSIYHLEQKVVYLPHSLYLQT